MGSQDETSGPVDHLFIMARHFVDIAIPESSLETIIREIPVFLSGNFEYNYENIEQLIVQIPGLVACVVVGFLFIVVFPLVTISFCCCRFCGYCGGHGNHDFGEHSGQWRILLQFFLLACLAFIVAGILCVYLSSEYLVTGVNRTGPALSRSIDEVFTFVGNTSDGLVNISNVLKLEFNNTKESIVTLLDGIVEDIGTQVVTLLSTGLGDIITIVDNIQKEAGDIGDSLNLVDGNLTLMVNNTEDLQAEVVVVQTLFQEAIDACLSQVCRDTLNAVKPGIDAFGNTVSSIDTSQFRPASLNDTIYQVNFMLATNYSSMISQQFNIIPEMISNMSGEFLEPAKDMIRVVNLSSLIDPMLDMVEDNLDSLSLIRTSLNIDDMIGDVSTNAELYGGYVHLGVSGLLSLPGLTVMFGVIGLLLGICCTSNQTPADLRTSWSNTAGCCLMTSVVLASIVGWILMLLATILFFVTTPISITLCRLDFDYFVRVEKIAADNGMFSVQSLIPPSFPINLTISGVLWKCNQGDSVIDALGLDVVVDKFLADFDIAGQIEDMTRDVDLGSFDEMSSGVGDQLSGITDVIQQFDMDIIITQLGAVDSLFNTSNPNALDMADQMVNISLQMPSMESASASKLNDTADQLRGPVHSATLAINDTKADIVAVLEYIDGDIQQILTLVNDTMDAVLVLQQTVMINGTSIIVSAGVGIFNDLMPIIDSLIDVLLEVGRYNLKCKPITDIFTDVVHVTLCGFLINPLNGFWFCMGQMVFFFTCSIIVAVRLAKYYRRMDYTDDIVRPFRTIENKGPSTVSVKKPKIVTVKQYGYIGDKRLKQQHFKNRVFPGGGWG